MAAFPGDRRAYPDPGLSRRGVLALLLVLMALVLGGCGGGRKHREQHASQQQQPARTAQKQTSASREVQDAAPAIPPDVARIPEPVPKAEPRSRYGNHSPYEVFGKRYHVLPSARGYVKRGIASWYGTKFHGRPTSSYEPYDMYKFTAAHKTLPLPTFVRVTNIENGRSIVVRVNDRGPFKDDRIIDLSYAAAIKLGIHVKGTGMVEVRALDPDHPEARPLAGAGPAEAPKMPANRPRGRIYLQVGAFSNRDNAHALERRLEKARFKPVNVHKGEGSGRTVYRVRIGPLADANEAARIAERVREAGHGTPTRILD